MDLLIYHNKQFYDSDTPLISPLDLSVIRGHSVCDTFRTFNKLPFCLDSHIDRFLACIKEISLTLTYTRAEIKHLVLTMLDKASIHQGELVGKLLLTPGTAPGTYFSPSFAKSLSPKFFIVLMPLEPFPSSYYSQGVILKTIPYTREFPNIKTTNYSTALCSLSTNNSDNASNIHDVLYTNAQGQILEAGTANFFAINAQGVLCTAPSQNVLNGITRDLVLKLAKQHRLPINLSSPNLSDLSSYKAAFITSCNRSIMPVCQIDSTLLPPPSSCEELKNLSNLMQEFIIKNNFYNAVDI
ncbi:hypothetical protein COB21_06075 [Candidatus Aerophobetes bacterium]|uniref:Branched-chain amino acid aminotransferase n=1 Tax=Aerophobetes bacterium TaxID=2030807 RepID=A0A2A4WZ34_UNCAE|nr:MAG: hypothetical protein COB21_06075 [Candidatus Aerophobetes bacterium]